MRRTILVILPFSHSKCSLTVSPSHTKRSKREQDTFEAILPCCIRRKTPRCAKFIQLFKFGGTLIIPNVRCRANPVFQVFHVPIVSRPVTLLNIHVKTVARICKNAMPKSRLNNPRLLSILNYIFFNLFSVVP